MYKNAKLAKLLFFEAKFWCSCHHKSEYLMRKKNQFLHALHMGFSFPCQNTDAAGRDNLRRKQYRANEDGPKPKETFRTRSPQFPVGKIQCSLHTKLSTQGYILSQTSVLVPTHFMKSSLPWRTRQTRKEPMTASYNSRMKTA